MAKKKTDTPAEVTSHTNHAAWTLLSTDPDGKTEMLPVPGGVLYRTIIYGPGDAGNQPSTVGLVFAAAIKKRKK